MRYEQHNMAQRARRGRAAAHLHAVRQRVELLHGEYEVRQSVGKQLCAIQPAPVPLQLRHLPSNWFNGGKVAPAGPAQHDDQN